MVDVWEVVAVVGSFVIGLLVSKAYYGRFKKLLHQLRMCIDSIDDALSDDTLTREEVKKIVENCKKIVESRAE
ncbi:MAG: hypothetical protein ABC596_08295 [Candidatus Methanosuratincola petrocarbonis]